MDLQECYRCLDLPVGASRSEIDAAYRDTAQAWHPDRFPADSKMRGRAHERIKRINQAYKVLCSRVADAPPVSSAPAPKQNEVQPAKRENANAKKQFDDGILFEEIEPDDLENSTVEDVDSDRVHPVTIIVAAVGSCVLLLLLFLMASSNDSTPGQEESFWMGLFGGACALSSCFAFIGLICAVSRRRFTLFIRFGKGMQTAASIFCIFQVVILLGSFTITDEFAVGFHPLTLRWYAVVVPAACVQAGFAFVATILAVLARPRDWRLVPQADAWLIAQSAGLFVLSFLWFVCKQVF